MDVFVYQEYKVQEACGVSQVRQLVGVALVFFASYYAIGRRKYQLPRWEEIGVTSGN
jgi:hypothetical protein